MEVLFENCYIRDKELIKEIFRFFYFQRKFRVVCNVLLSLSFLVNVLIAIFEKTMNWFVLIGVPLFFLYQIYIYIRQVNVTIKRDEEVFSGEILVKTIVTNEYIQCLAPNGSVQNVTYDKIKNAVQTKKLILLRSKASLTYILRKDGFTKGTREEFLAFLVTKGVKIK